MSKWSRKYDRCRGCGTREKSHYAKGLCRNCYRKKDYWQNVDKERTKRKEYYDLNKDKVREYYLSNRERLLRYQKMYYLIQKYKGKGGFRKKDKT